MSAPREYVTAVPDQPGIQRPCRRINPDNKSQGTEFPPTSPMAHITEDIDIYTMIEAIVKNSPETTEDQPQSWVESTFPTSTGEISDHSVESLHASEDHDDSFQLENTASRSESEMEDQADGRWVTASLVEFVTRDLGELRIDSPPLRGGFAREYYSRLRLAESNLSILTSRSHAIVACRRLLEDQESFHRVNENVVSNLWALLVCIKFTCMRKDNRWANLCHFARIWKETGCCFTKPDIPMESGAEKKHDLQSVPQDRLIEGNDRDADDDPRESPSADGDTKISRDEREEDPPGYRSPQPRKTV